MLASFKRKKSVFFQGNDIFSLILSHCHSHENPYNPSKFISLERVRIHIKKLDWICTKGLLNVV